MADAMLGDAGLGNAIVAYLILGLVLLAGPGRRAWNTWRERRARSRCWQQPPHSLHVHSWHAGNPAIDIAGPNAEAIVEQLRWIMRKPPSKAARMFTQVDEWLWQDWRGDEGWAG